MRLLGVDLAWGEGSEAEPANLSGVVALQDDGGIADAGWTTGLQATAEWIERLAHSDTLLFVDAPLVVDNLSGQRLCETQVGQRYGTWLVSANSTNLKSKRQAGVKLRKRLEASGWRYDDGHSGPPSRGRVVSECYPYTTVVGATELGYETRRPPYKRKPKKMTAAEFRPIRNAACDGLIRSLAKLADHDPPMDLASHPVTARLVNEPSPDSNVAYKKREDLLDAAICAWTAALWARFGTTRCQVLGPSAGSQRLVPTIIAPARPKQRCARSQQ